MFSGDIAMRAQPAFASPIRGFEHWLASLDQLDALKPAIDRAESLARSAMRDSSRAIGPILPRCATARRRRNAPAKNVDQAVEAVTAALVARFPDRVRLGQAIKVAYAEAP